MIKALAKSILRKAGYQISRIPQIPKQPEKISSTQEATTNQVQAVQTGFACKIAQDPLNAELHFQFALDASNSGNHFLAYAELKTAEVLGADREQIEKHSTAFRNALPDLNYMNHNTYFRLKSLENEIVERANGSNLSILDVGGGDGKLAAFLPQNFKYCLVEPTVNGISGTDLPFANYLFDYVVSCHVLEHIPGSSRVSVELVSQDGL